jgi:hypothetical protein
MFKRNQCVCRDPIFGDNHLLKKECSMRIRTILLLLGPMVLVATAYGGSQLLGQTFGDAKSVTSTVEMGEVPPIINPKLPLEAFAEVSSDVRPVLLALRATGFDPQEVQLTPGEYLFVIRNQTGLDEVGIHLVRQRGEQVAGASAKRRHQDFKRRLRLTAGSYLVMVDGYPDWTCQILVGP